MIKNEDYIIINSLMIYSKKDLNKIYACLIENQDEFTNFFLKMYDNTYHLCLSSYHKLIFILQNYIKKINDKDYLNYDFNIDDFREVIGAIYKLYKINNADVYKLLEFIKIDLMISNTKFLKK